MSACTNCIALKLIPSCEWKLWQPLLSLQFYQKSPRWNHGNEMWHQKTRTSKAAYTVIRICGSLLSGKRYMICWTFGFSPTPSSLILEPVVMWKPMRCYTGIYSNTLLYVWVHLIQAKWRNIFLPVRQMIMHDDLHFMLTSAAYWWYL